MNLSYYFLFIVVCSLVTFPIFAFPQNFKSLQAEEEERRLHKRKKPGNQGSNPCHFGGYGRPKTQESGRTFFDLQFFNVEHNYQESNNLNINCGGGGGGYGGAYPQPAPVSEIPNEDLGGVLGGINNKPLGGHKPFGGGGGHKPIFAGSKPGKPGKPGHGHGGGGGLFSGGLFGGNRPPRPPFQQQGGEYNGPLAGFFPSPQQFATGLSDGLQTFIGTIPAIAQSFQSLLPNFQDFQLPSLPSLPNFGGPSQFIPLEPGNGIVSNQFNRPSTFQPATSTFPSVVAPSAQPPAIVTTAATTTTTDPDDIIYNDGIKPVHEDYDPILDTYSNKLPPDHLSPGQYLVVSNPYLGSYTQDLSFLKPTNLYNAWQQGVKVVLDELSSYF